MATKSEGNCYLCGATLGQVAMKSHLFKEHGEETDGKKCSLFKIEGAYNKNYWLYIDVPVDKTLEDLDHFLRSIWMECCGHMSMFCYDKYDEMNMHRKIGSFSVGEQFNYLYDMGSTTETIITVAGSTTRKPQKAAVRLMARNVPPEHKCKDCGKPAELLLIDYEGDSEFLYYCEDCAEDQDEEMLLSVTNSPRMGECGYNGDLDVYTFDPALVAKKEEAVPPQKPLKKKKSREGKNA